MSIKNLLPYPKFPAMDAKGAPLAGGKLYSYDTSGDPKDSYRNAACTVPNANPLVLDSVETVFVEAQKTYYRVFDSGMRTNLYVKGWRF
jgi:hypothetical protein